MSEEGEEKKPLHFIKMSLALMEKAGLFFTASDKQWSKQFQNRLQVGKLFITLLSHDPSLRA